MQLQAVGTFILALIMFVASASASSTSLQFVVDWGNDTFDPCPGRKDPSEFATSHPSHSPTTDGEEEAQDEAKKRISLAIAMGNIAGLEQVLDNNPELLEVKGGPRGSSWLDFAVAMGRAAIAQLLIERGLSPHEELEAGTTLLFQAARFPEQAEIIDLLVRHGLDPNTAATGKRIAGMTPLHMAAGKGHRDTAKALIKNGADPNLRESKVGWAPLHSAAKAGATAAVDVLLDAGGDIHLRDWEGRTPLHIAVLAGNQESTALFLERKANPDSVDKDGFTPLYLAVIEDDPDMVQTLLSGGADPDKKSKVGSTPLYEAAFQGYVETVRTLLEGGADIGLAKEFAEVSGHPEVVEAIESYVSSQEQPPESD